jgi:hypothetical protein
MRVNRKFLYWGVFLLAMGVVMVAADLDGIDESVVGDALRLWPLVFVGIGLALVLRRTRFSLAGGMIAAALPGLALGGLIAVGPQLAVDCGAGEPSSFVTRQGVFDGPARIDVTTDCGALFITTGSGTAWQLEAGNTRGREAVVHATATSLSIGSERRSGWFGHDGRDVWRLALPPSATHDLDVVVNAGEGQVDLPGAQLGRLSVTTNAGRSSLDLSGTSLDSLSGTVNAGELIVRLPSADDFDGSIAVNAGSVEICSPPGLGLQIQHTGALGSTSFNGLEQSGGVWRSPDYESADHLVDLIVSVNFGNLEINPIGGCK